VTSPVPVAAPKLRRTPEQWDEGGLLEFAERYAAEMWPSETHRGRSMNQLKRFIEFEGIASRLDKKKGRRSDPSGVSTWESEPRPERKFRTLQKCVLIFAIP
jgi:hypothetical protein